MRARSHLTDLGIGPPLASWSGDARATLALVKAIDRFDSSRGHAFSSFAVPTIVGELKRHLRDRTWSVRPPRELQELIMKIARRSGWHRSSTARRRSPSSPRRSRPLADAPPPMQPDGLTRRGAACQSSASIPGVAATTLV